MINWTTTDGILAVDKNGNGTIDNGSEVFGDSFVLENGETAKNGFEALSQYDENGDGVIDAKDAAYSQLRVWIDENGDGISQENELYTLTQMGVKSISLDFVDSGRPTDSETVIGHEAAFTSKDGKERNIGEAWVASNHFNSIDKLVVEPSETVNGLPNVAGFGKIHSLHTAITLDTTGTLESMVKAFTESDDNAERRSIVADILVKLSNAESVEPGSRGRNIDAVQMAVIEAAMGETFNGVSGTDPNNAAASVLKDMYNKIVDAYYYSMIGSTLSKYIGLIGVTENADGGKTYELRAFEMMTMFGLENGTLSEKDFKDLCGYVDFFSLLVEDDHSLFLEVRNFYDVYGDKYLSLVDNSFTNAILGTDEDDILSGTNKDDVIISNKGADEITAGSGSDFIIAGDDNDTVYANDGNDTLDGGKGDDTLYGGYG
ncbi:MAG TPA: hypothetical protein DHV89_06260, partial [Ruminococcus sp.]|nr:hypothetical protein [Ruminococcus sp.]